MNLVGGVDVAVHFECGAEVDAVEVTAFGESEPRFVPGRHHGPCRLPRCPFCHQLLDERGHCQHLDCWHCGHVVPLPEVIA